MIDFVKCHIEGYSKRSAQDRIEFPSLLDHSTGELLKIESEEVHLRNLKVKPLTNGNAKVTGSIHSYYNLGLDGFVPKGRNCCNYDDFTFSKLCNAIYDFCHALKVDPTEMRLVNIESGVNISTAIPVSDLLNSVVMSKGKIFSDQRPSGKHFRECVFNRYFVKLYDKGLQARSGRYLLRYELKFMDMGYLNRDLFSNFDAEIRTLSDLMDINKLSALGRKLASSLKDIVFSDPSINESNLNRREREIYLKGSNPNWWIGQYNKGDANLNRFKKRYNQVLEVHGQCDIKSMIESGVLEKWQSLLK